MVDIGAADTVQIVLFYQFSLTILFYSITYMDPPPTNQSFLSREEAQSYCQNWAKNHGYALVTRSTERRKLIGQHRSGPVYLIRLQCDRSGLIRKSTTISGFEVRNRQTNKTNCLFRLAIREHLGTWNISLSDHTSHNHEPSIRPQQHAILRRQERFQNPILETTISANQRAGISARNTFISLSSQSETLQTPKDIQNRYSHQKQLQNQGLLPIQVMMTNLGSDFHYDYERDIDNCLNRLTLFHKETTQLLCLFPFTLVLDITYKTNRFGLYLLNIVGFTTNNNSFLYG